MRKIEYNGFKIGVIPITFRLYVNGFPQGEFGAIEDAVEHAKNSIDSDQDPYPGDEKEEA